MEKSKHRIIDCHVHLDKITEIDGFLEIMDATGVSAVNALALVNPMPPWWATPDTPDWHRRDATRDFSVNLASVMFKALQPDRVYVFGNLEHSTPRVLAGQHDYARQARTLIDMGVDGFKMWEGGTALRVQTGLPLDSPAYDEYYSLLESESLPILYHVNPPYRHEVDALLLKHPNLKIIFAHFHGGARELDRLGRFLDTWPNVYVDLAPGMIFRSLSDHRDEAREFFIRHQDRILFGTDATATDPEDVEWGKSLVGLVRRFLERKNELALAEIGLGGREDVDGDLNEWERLARHELHPERGLYLDDDVLAKIYAGNFTRIVGVKARNANCKIALSECQKLLEGLRDKSHEAQSEQRRQRMTDHLREVDRIAATFRTMA